MAQLNFYATAEDVVDLVNFMFSIARMKLYEAYSRVDGDIRSFECGEDILRSGHIDDNHGRVFIRGWWESVTRNPRVEKFNLKPDVGGFRHVVEGVGTFQITQGWRKDLPGRPLDRSIFSHWNEAGARQRATCTDEDLNEVDWNEFRSLSGKVHRHVRNRISVAKLNQAHILPGAMAYLENGGRLFGYPMMIDIASSAVQRNRDINSEVKR